MKRLLIYFFWDKEGIVDDYVTYFLGQFRPFCTKICVVVNGDLTLKSKEKLAPYTDDLLLKENTGMDAGAYQYAIRHYGYEQLAEYDELILTNFTLFGPFFSLTPLFETMDAKKCDWWGFFKWYTVKPKTYRHIPSFFVAYRKSLLASKDFKEYWETLDSINTYKESILNHEQRQTLYYQSRGFQEETYIDDAKYQDFWEEHWPLCCADRVVIEDKFPFIKRRLFFIEKHFFLYANVILKFMHFLDKTRHYDKNLIIENIRRTQDFSSLNPKIKFSWKIKTFLCYNKKKRQKYKNKIQNVKLIGAVCSVLKKENSLETH